jgi:hypothetical protein
VSNWIPREATEEAAELQRLAKRTAIDEGKASEPLQWPDLGQRPADSGQRTRRTDIAATLDERGKRYGEFTAHAQITQDLKWIMHRAPKWRNLRPDQKEALEMVQHKIGRILNGDPDFHDSWHDIVGYAKLVADRLEAK